MAVVALVLQTIVNISEWLSRLENIKVENKDFKVHGCAQSLIHYYVTDTFLLVSSSVSGKQLLCFVQGQDQNRNEQKHSTKNFVGFHNHILL